MSREIAEEGARWSRQVLRTEDMSVYVYRLLLELADIYNPEVRVGDSAGPISPQ